MVRKAPAYAGKTLEDLGPYETPQFDAPKGAAYYPRELWTKNQAGQLCIDFAWTKSGELRPVKLIERRAKSRAAAMARFQAKLKERQAKELIAIRKRNVQHERKVTRLQKLLLDPASSNQQRGAARFQLHKMGVLGRITTDPEAVEARAREAERYAETREAKREYQQRYWRQRGLIE